MKKQEIEYLPLWNELKYSKSKIRRHEVIKKLVEIYYPLVQKCSYSMAKKLEWNITPEELSSYGVDGLYDSIEKFDTEMGVSFPCYSSIRIKGSMIDGLRKDDEVPRTVRMYSNLIDKVKNELIAEKGLHITEIDVLNKAGIDCKDFRVNNKKYVPFYITSIDGSDLNKDDYDDFKQDISDTLIDNKIESSDNNILSREFFCKLLGSGFSREEQKIIYFYYYENLTMEDIGTKMSYSESRVSQIHANALLKLKDKINRNPVYFSDYLKK